MKHKEKIPIHIISEEEAEEVAFVVCMAADGPSYFADNLTGFCCKCGIKVMYRWHAPRKPKKICLQCMVLLQEEKGE